MAEDATDQPTITDLLTVRINNEADTTIRNFCLGLTYAKATSALFQRIQWQKSVSVDVGLPIDEDEADKTSKIVVHICSTYGVSKSKLANHIDLLIGIQGATTLSSSNPTLVHLMQSA